jgi:hypothetical protein
MRRLITLILLAACVAPAGANASQLVDRNLTSASLAVNNHGVALVTYRVHGSSTTHHVLFWGGVNWTLHLQYDRSGGWASHVASWKSFQNRCRPYTGPTLSGAIAACDAPDGSYWALQSWQRLKRDWGGRSAAVETNVSHWTGSLPVLWMKFDWGWHGRFVAVYGQYTFHGRAVRLGAHTATGRVLDGKGRNVAIDAWNSDFGPGWARVNMILAHNPNGQFCYDFSPKGHGPYSGRSYSGQYRLSAQGPGVGPDLVNQSFLDQAGAYNAAKQAQADSVIRHLNGGSDAGSSCHPPAVG